MNSNFRRLESLPNEILMDIFQFFDAAQLFHAFYNLNTRLNTLLQALHDLSHTFSRNNYIEDEFFPYIRFLVIDRAIDINLNRFIQIRCLVLRYPTDRLLLQLNHETLPQLEHLSINHMHNSTLNYVPNVCTKIFSDGFPNLKSCNLLEWGTITKAQGWTTTLSLNILKVGKIDLLIYKIILVSCPNLKFLQLATLTSNDTCFSLQPHANLKRMNIKTTAFIQPWKDEDIDVCLAYVPNLEYFNIHQTHRYFKQGYDWLASIIARRLPCLKRLYFYLYIFDAEFVMESNMEYILNKMKKNFRVLHHNRYQSRLIIERAELF